MEDAHSKLVYAIQERLELEKQALIVQRKIEYFKERETFFLGELSKPKDYVTPKNPFIKPKKQEPLKAVKTVICGKNGCKFASTKAGILKHVKVCDGPAEICKICGYFNEMPSVQKTHNNTCLKKQLDDYKSSNTIEIPPIEKRIAL